MNCLSLVLVAAALGAPKALAAAPSFKKVVVVVFENTSYDEALQQPFFAKLAKEGALLTNYHALSHPSQPNYIGLIAGQYSGVNGDGPVNLNYRHLGDALEDAGKTWKVYAQDYPGNCFLGSKSGGYARKHVPFLSFKDVQTDKKRCANVVDDSKFSSDFSGGRLADFSLFVPNLDNDGHDTGAAFADKWFSSYFGPLLPSFGGDTLLVATFDEDDNLKNNNQVFAALYGGGALPGSSSADSYDHYSLLRTIENALGAATLGQNDDGAAAIGGVWR